MSIFPLSASAGQQFTTSSNITYIFNGESWIVISTKGILVCTSSTRPGSPSEGQLIFETDTDQVLVWNGTEWAEISGGGGTVLFQDSQPDVSELEPGALWVDSNENIGTGLDIQTFLRWSKTLSASTSTISGYDDNTNNLLYTPGFELVYINGTLINRGIDYTATSGNTVALTEAASAGDLIEIHAFESFILSDMYTKNESDNRYATQEDLNNIDLSATIQTASAAAVTYLVDGAPAALNTLNELSEALNDNESFATTVTNELSSKLSISSASSIYLPQTTASAIYLAQSSPVTGFKNKIINGNMSIWQRGTTFSSIASGAYSADRWYYGNAAASNYTISRQLTNDTTNLPNIQYCARIQRTSGNTSTAGQYFANVFETVNSIPLVGKTVTLSYYARVGSNWSPTSFQANIVSGTGVDQGLFAGVGSTTVVNGNPNLTTNWQRFTITGTVLSNQSQIAVFFTWNAIGTAGVNDYIEITGVQLEEGPTATSFEQRFIGTELQMCQRYYETGTFGNNVLTASYNSNAYQGGPGFPTNHISFKVTKRITPHTIPTLTISGMWTAPGSFGVTANTNHTFIAVDASPDSFKFITNRVVGNVTPTVASMYHWESSPWSWSVSAEL